ncbi:MAG: hypothetical protein CSA82_02295 [Actinobacteria bacterium]|nr:MAG: hypothetical protein CSA82_02295 [Actinomycetota bacterium]
MPKTAATKTRKSRADAVLSAAVDLAREAAVTVTRADTVGEHLGFEMDAERLGTHYFASTEEGYIGWRWAVTLARVPRGKTATVCEIDMVPGEESLLAPPWVPWEERLIPSDLSRDDFLPFRAVDERLDQSYEATDEDADEAVSHELGLGRPRVLSAQGRAEAIERWYASEQGPRRGRLPKATCSTCGFLVKMSGSIRRLFGVCANGWSQDDGRVVSLDHTCGAHSETDVPKSGSEWPIQPPYLNDFVVDTQKIGKD